MSFTSTRDPGLIKAHRPREHGPVVAESPAQTPVAYPHIALVVPPVEGGVTDYATRLQAAVGRGGATVLRVNKARREALTSQRDALMVQYSGYGYAKRGAPLWLLRELETRRAEIGRLGVFFHEVYAFGPAWSSSFWMSPFQRNIARRLVDLCDFWVTNREESATWLRRWGGGKPNRVLPVFSTVGESATLPATRSKNVVVFGGSAVRRRTYTVVGDRLFAWARSQSLTIHDVGPSMNDASVARLLNGNNAVQHGRLPEPVVSGILAEARFGVIGYPVDCLAKSTVFAAYCAHGICPLVISSHDGPADGLSAGHQYIPGIPSGPVSETRRRQIGDAAWAWYQPHGIGSHAAALERLMAGTDSVAC